MKKGIVIGLISGIIVGIIAVFFAPKVCSNLLYDLHGSESSYLVCSAMWLPVNMLGMYFITALHSLGIINFDQLSEQSFSILFLLPLIFVFAIIGLIIGWIFDRIKFKYKNSKNQTTR